MKYVETIRRAELAASDLLPTCPDCGDFAHPTLTCCEGCGAHLYPSINKPVAASPSGSRAATGTGGQVR